jgi:hypothetical protein
MVACAASLAICFAQGWTRAPAGLDFYTYYAPARVWLAGGNPYDRAAMAKSAFADFPDLAAGSSMASPLPPSGLLLVAPMALLGPRVALKVMWLLSFGALIASLLLMMRLWASNWTASERWLMAAVLLQSRLIQSIAYRGQPALLMLAATLAALWAERRGHRALAGAAAAALSIKFTFGLPLAAYWVAQRRWRELGWAAGFSLALCLPLVVQIGPSAVASGFVDCVRYLDAWNHADPHAFHLTSWTTILDRLLGPAGNTVASALAVAAAALLFRQSRAVADFTWAGFAALGTVALYHRVYDAILLLPVLVLCWDRLRRGRRYDPALLLTTVSGVALLFVFAWQPLSERASGWLAMHAPAFAPINAWTCVALLAGIIPYGSLAARTTDETVPGELLGSR